LTPARAKLSPADILILIAGALMLIGSFLAFYTVPGQSFNAWSHGLFGIATVVVFCGVAMAGQVALSNWGSVSLSPRPFGMSWDQVHLALGFQTAIMMLAFLAQNHNGVGLGIGFWLMLVAAIALFVGAIMRNGRHRRPHLRST
jgi:hypothetical protein